MYIKNEKLIFCAIGETKQKRKKISILKAALKKVVDSSDIVFPSEIARIGYYIYISTFSSINLETSVKVSTTLKCIGKLSFTTTIHITLAVCPLCYYYNYVLHTVQTM